MNKFLDMNSLERARYGSMQYTDIASKNISKQYEQLALLEKQQTGNIDESDFDIDNQIASLEKFFRSNNSFLNQLNKYFVGNVATNIKPGVYNQVLAILGKITYQFGIMQENYKDIIDILETDNIGLFDYKKFDKVVDLYKKFYQIMGRFTNYFNPIARNNSNLNRNWAALPQDERDNISAVNPYLFEILQNGLSIQNSMARLKRLSEKLGAIGTINR